MDEDTIKLEMRLFALESIVCQHLATFYQAMPPALLEAAHKQGIDGARKRAFLVSDPAYSDLLSAELETAIDRLYKMIEHHLETARKRAGK